MPVAKTPNHLRCVRIIGDELAVLPAQPQKRALTLRGRRMGAITCNV